MTNHSKQVLDDIRSKIDLVDFLEKRGVALHPSGLTWKGLCPVHNERTPSFHVNRELQTFRCFGCGISGDVFNLLREMDSLSFPASVREAAETAGVVLVESEPDPDYEKKRRLLEACLLASKWFRHSYKQLPQSHPAKMNLSERNLYELSVTDESIGYAPKTGTLRMMTEKGFSVDELIEAGLVKISSTTNEPVEVFRDRLMWTLTDVQGKPVGFSGRTLGEDGFGPKYVNTPQTLLYSKSKTLLGLSAAKRTIMQQQRVFVVEGQTDVMAMRAAGLENTVASCGTAFGTEHGNMLLHLAKQGKNAADFNVVFCFDGDAAGVHAAEAVFDRIPELHPYARVAQLPEQAGLSDPSDYFKSHGRELATYVEHNQVPLVEFVLREKLKQSDTTTAEGMLAFLNNIRPVIQKVQNQFQRQAYLRKVASWTGASVSELTNMLDRPAHPQQGAPVENKPVAATYRVDPWEDKMLAAIIQYPNQMIELMKDRGVKLSFFQHRMELARELLTLATKEESFDFSDPAIAWLSHLRLAITEGREREALAVLVDGFIKHRYHEAVRLLNSTPISDDGFVERLQKQAELKTLYGQ